eukprot:Hpha_TRINITY_DN9205_c0_g4::TRINITY_DN9205_c0_g4_i1::g.28864::m.28864/K12898/HNRNPF_H; heterogeneous nuclear ribonucleoprotein F/H
MEKTWKSTHSDEESDPLVIAIQEKAVVLVKGVQARITVASVQGFFAPLEVPIKNVSITPASTGEVDVFVRCLSKGDWHQALCFSGRALLGNFIDVLPATESQFEDSVKAPRPVHWDALLFVRCANLPIDAVFDDIEQLLAPLPFNRGGVFLAHNAQGAESRTAYVQMFDASSSRAAVQQSAPPGGECASVHPVSSEELQQLMATGALQNIPPQAPDLGDPSLHDLGVIPHSPPPPRPISRHVVRLRGLPFATTEFDLARFFEGIGIENRGIHLMFSADEKALGEAFVELRTREDVELAFGRDRMLMGYRYVEVFASNPGELQWMMDNAVKLTPPLVDVAHLAPQMNALFPLPHNYPYRHKFEWCVSMQSPSNPRDMPPPPPPPPHSQGMLPLPMQDIYSV